MEKDIEVTFRCGTRASVKSIFLSDAYLGVGVNSGSLQNIERLKRKNIDLAREIFNVDHVILTPPEIRKVEHPGAVEFEQYETPPYICIAELRSFTAIGKDEDFSFAIVEWYQEYMKLEIDSTLSQFAKATDWKSIAKGGTC